MKKCVKIYKSILKKKKKKRLKWATKLALSVFTRGVRQDTLPRVTSYNKELMSLTFTFFTIKSSPVTIKS